MECVSLLPLLLAGRPCTRNPLYFKFDTAAMMIVEEWMPILPGKRDLAGVPYVLPTGCSVMCVNAGDLKIQKEMKKKGYQLIFGVVSGITR